MQIQEELKSTIAVLELNSLPKITVTEWSTLKLLCEVLLLFEEMTVELSAEKNVTISKVLCLIYDTKRNLAQFKTEANAAETPNVLNTTFLDSTETEANEAGTPNVLYTTFLDKIIDVFKTRMKPFERSSQIAEATVLDPRMKGHGFSPNSTNFATAEKSVLALACK